MKNQAARKPMRPCGIHRERSPAGYHSAAVLLVLLSIASIGQTPAQNPDTSAAAERIPTEVLVEPHVSKPAPFSYPETELRKNGEGWVTLGLMVDPTGKPFEVTVNASSGNKVFEQVAIEAMERTTFKPALLNGQPVESATEFKYTFVISDESLRPMSVARTDFVYKYRDLQKAIAAKNRPQADAAMKLLQVQNLYEDAFFGLATYAYAREWGDETQQLAGLQRATAHDYKSPYLTAEQSKMVKLESFLLELKLHRYAEVMDLWPTILKSGIEPATIEKLTPLIHQVEQVRVQHQRYSLSGSMPDATWRIGLYEENFRINVSQGHISQIKLRCSKGFVRFTFDPEIEYKVASKHGNCNMELDGDPGTSFTLTQF
jgi:TonB family protein